MARQRRANGADAAFRLVVKGSSVGVLALIGLVVAFLVVEAVPALRRSGISFLTARNWLPDLSPHFGVAALAWGTVLSSAVALVLAVPVALGTALFLTEVAPKRTGRVIGWLVDLLAAVPSVVFGLWGVIFLVPRMVPFERGVDATLGFVPLLHSPTGTYGRSIFAAGVVLAIMILPIIAALAREVLAQVPRASREAALALGASRWEVIRTAVLPPSRSGLVAATMLGLGRALGETIAVALVLATSFTISIHILQPGGNTLAANIATRFGEAGSTGRSALIASGLVLFAISIVVNGAARALLRLGARRRARAARADEPAANSSLAEQGPFPLSAGSATLGPPAGGLAPAGHLGPQPGPAPGNGAAPPGPGQYREPRDASAKIKPGGLAASGLAAAATTRTVAADLAPPTPAPPTPAPAPSGLTGDAPEPGPAAGDAREPGPAAGLRRRRQGRGQVAALALVGAGLAAGLTASGRMGPAQAVVAGLAAFLVLQVLGGTVLEGRRAGTNRLATTLMGAAVVLAVLPLIAVLAYTVAQGYHDLSPMFLTHSLKGVGPLDADGGEYHAIVGTLEQVGIAAVISIPLGLAVAVSVVEYGGGRLAPAVRFVMDVMTGIPSIVAGLFIFAFWVLGLGLGFSGLAAGLSLAVLMLPIVMRSSEEMLRLVPADLREASLALGVPRWRTVCSVVVPTASAGITTGVVLALARVSGETAPLLLTAFGFDAIRDNPFHGPQSSLPLFVFAQASSAFTVAVRRAWAGALTLVVLVLALTIVARAVSQRNRLA